MKQQRTIYSRDVKPVEKPQQSQAPEFGVGAELVEVDILVRASEARSKFKVDGSETTVAVLDTGCRSTHVDFDGRIITQKNYTDDNGADPDDASDGNGHGTNVTGIIAAGSDHIGMAPGASIVPIKVLNNDGRGSFNAVADALSWVLEHHSQHAISACCMSLGDGENYNSDLGFPNDEIQRLVRQLRNQRVAVVVAAGNDYRRHDSRQGMGYPSIFRETISVGAVYDAVEGAFSYGGGATAHSTAPDRLTPFSQRLHESISPHAHTDIFAPGAPVTSAGILSDNGESTQHGTSQAAPVITGTVALLQSYHKRLTGSLPDIADIITWLRAGGKSIFDGDDEHDNVAHTNLSFQRVDAVGALSALHRHLQVAALNTAATVA